MRVGGPARFFTEAHTAADIREAALFARRHDLPLFPLGSGSNIVVSDEGVHAVVLRMATRGTAYEQTPHGDAIVIAAAGEPWDGVVAETVARGLGGLENLSLIPGTVGAVPVQNVGAYGVEAADRIIWVEAFDAERLAHFVMTPEECAFGYRDSIFKRGGGKNLIITRVAFRLRKDHAPVTEYADIARYLADMKNSNPSPADIRDAVTAIRRAKLPDPNEIGTVGSFFKNPLIPQAAYEELKERFPECPGFPADGGLVKVPLAWILDHICGMRGLKDGAVGAHERQPLALVHYGGGTARSVRAFSEMVRNKVHEKTGIMPEYEVSFVGRFD